MNDVHPSTNMSLWHDNVICPVWQVADSLGLHATGSLEEWHQATRRVCSMSYEEFSTTYSHVKHRRRDGLCFDATYLYVLLSEVRILTASLSSVLLDTSLLLAVFEVRIGSKYNSRV